MDVDTAFDRFDSVITPSAAQRRVAAGRVARFTAMLEALGHGVEVLSSDAGFIVVYPAEAAPGRGSAAALRQVRNAVAEQLEAHFGRSPGWTTTLRDGVVRCSIDSAGAAKGFSVDVMPAVRDGSRLRVPGRRGDGWRDIDPQERRAGEWEHYPAMVRLLRYWGRDSVAPLTMELLARRCLPVHASRTAALKRFFTAAAATGEVEPGVRDRFRVQADLAATAEAWARSGHPDGPDIAVHFLRLMVGPQFPKPARDWSDVGVGGDAGPRPRAAAAGGVSLRNPDGHRAALPAAFVAAPAAPRAEDPAG
ncbi:hypothetical protein [Dactylosporangium sp. NPDC051541]|uniref:hypothetical protein n=1 Tax=Dactylosporangium sp. NPDC051541 TaxID=3363977 RepID=UPI00378C1E78